ncbi:MAG: hypothetical protein LUF83_12870 [Alistipes sp.]|nr:hypothetical protein [Alistipes sp.]
MKKTSVYLWPIALVVLLMGCGSKNDHYGVTIDNQSDIDLIVTTSRVSTLMPNSNLLNVSISYDPFYIQAHGADYYKMVKAVEKITGPIGGNPMTWDKLRFYFIDSRVFNNAGGKPYLLKPDDFIGYIDLTTATAVDADWTIVFPRDMVLKE